MDDKINRNSSELTEIIAFKINCMYFEIIIGHMKKPFYNIDYPAAMSLGK